VTRLAHKDDKKREKCRKMGQVAEIMGVKRLLILQNRAILTEIGNIKLKKPNTNQG
jgi:predicted transcriptional regulator